MVKLTVPDNSDRFEDIVLGYDQLSSYENDPYYFGAVIGRYANRIANAQLSLNGRDYQLGKNDGQHHIHGGFSGFDKMLWDFEIEQKGSNGRVIFKYLSPHLEENYPGNLEVEVTYELTNLNEVKISYQAECDRDTHINLTNHAYFNLGGHSAGNILNQDIRIAADAFTELNQDLIPKGNVRSVEDTIIDMRNPVKFGQIVLSDDPLVKNRGGLDHNFVLNGNTETVKIKDHETGRVLSLRTTEPGIQVYTANGLQNVRGKEGVTYGKYSGFCLETQHFPDTPHHKHFPSTLLRKGEVFKSSTSYQFTVKK